MNVLSLFDGMSCGQIALNRAGIKYEKYFASEIDKHAIFITQFNYPDTIQLGDVTRLKLKELPKIDLLIGGSPCQGFSFAGKLKGASTSANIEILALEQYEDLVFDEFKFEGQSYLFWEYVKILRYLKPKHFLLENTLMLPKWKKIITEALGVEPIMLNSSSVSAQSRKRLYWTNLPYFEEPEDKGLLLKDVMEKDVDSKYFITERFKAKRPGTLAFKKAHSNIRTPEQKSKTLTTGGHGISNSGSTNILLPSGELRIPTPLEAERLQTVPDHYTSCLKLDSHRNHALGNGWTIDIIAHFFKYLDLEDLW